jgi:hypothetical protein
MPDKLFISYSHSDAEFVTRLATALHAGGQEVFLDRWELQLGDSIIDRIYEEGLKEASAFAIVLSAASIASPWVRDELNTATLRRITDRTRVIPILIEDVEVPMALRTLLWIDMRRDFDAGVRRILNTLHGVQERPAVAEAPAYLRGLPESVGGLSRLATRVGAGVLAANDPDSENERAFEGPELRQLLELTPQEINDAVDELEQHGLLSVIRTLGTGPFEFAIVEPTYLLFQHFRQRLAYDPMDDVRAVIGALAAEGQLQAEALKTRTGLSFGRLNRAVDYVREYGIADVHRFLGTHPYSFGYVVATRRTRQTAAEN